MPGEDTRLSKTLSYWLRHRPDAAGLVLDAQGWADVGAVVAALARTAAPAAIDRLRTIISRNDKQRSNFRRTASGSGHGKATPSLSRWTGLRSRRRICSFTAPSSATSTSS